jgi:hypothetical protein
MQRGIIGECGENRGVCGENLKFSGEKFKFAGKKENNSWKTIPLPTRPILH